MPIVLVTGATGFVGSILCKELLEKGWHVRGATRSPEHAVHLPEGVEIFRIKDIGPETDWSEALRGAETVVHLAARVHVMEEKSKDPLSDFRLVNTIGTGHLAREAAASGGRRFVFVSSVKVNGEGKETPYTEEDEPLPEDAYAISKWEAEQTLQNISGSTGLEVAILRPPLVYGPNVTANFLALLKWVKRGMPLPLGSITNQRSMMYVKNLVGAIITCMVHPDAADQTYLVKDGQDVSTPELIRRAAKALDVRPRLVPVPPAVLRTGGALAGKSEAVGRLTGSLVVDDSKIRRELGWKPAYTLEQGLQETADWFLERNAGWI